MLRLERRILQLGRGRIVYFCECSWGCVETSPLGPHRPVCTANGYPHTLLVAIQLFNARARCLTRLSEHHERILMRRSLVVALLVLTAALPAQQRESRSRAQQPRVEQVIRALDTERIQAQIHADAAALARIYADDFIGVGPSGTVRTKPQVIADFTSGALRFQSITTDDVQVHVYGNTAVETGRSTMQGEDKGRPVPEATRFTRVWVKLQGHWCLVANHYSSEMAQK